MDNGSGRRKYTKEFKEEAVRMVTEGDQTVREVANILGIHENQLHAWRRQYREDPKGSFPGIGKQGRAEEEVKRLEKENRELKLERAILKKALAIFSKHPE